MNYLNTFIAVASDTRATTGTAPPVRGDKKSIAVLEYEMIGPNPYVFTHEEIQFSVHVQRTGVSNSELKIRRAELWKEFFSKSMACMRTSPLAKTYGWGLHFNSEGKAALIAMESIAYQQLASDPTVEQTRAMRSKRA